MSAPSLLGVIGNSSAMQEVYRLTRKVAPTRASVLLMGETGTGKELIALSIHLLGLRAEGPYIRINCGALSENLLESELFGHVKGAFTGAIDNKTGRFEAAHTGTIFLDEISAMSPKLQVKLLRVLQEQEFERVGDSKTIKIDTRVVAATNQHLEEEVEAGRFREDLYYRLNVVPIHLPPLRERRDDIPQLIEYFVEKYSRENDKQVQGFSLEAMDYLRSYDWPGNVRELENYIERAIVLSESENLSLNLLPPQVRGESSPRILRARPMDLSATIEELVRLALRTSSPAVSDLYEKVVGAVERELIEQVLIACDQVRIRAAARLGINRNTLHKKLKEFELTSELQPPSQPEKRSSSA